MCQLLNSYPFNLLIVHNNILLTHVFEVFQHFPPKATPLKFMLMTDKPRGGAHTTEDNVHSKISIEPAIKNK